MYGPNVPDSFLDDKEGSNGLMKYALIGLGMVIVGFVAAEVGGWAFPAAIGGMLVTWGVEWDISWR